MLVGECRQSGAARRRTTGTNCRLPCAGHVPPQIAHGVGCSPLNRSDARNGCSRFSPNCAEPGRRRRGVAHGCAQLPCRGQDIRYARLPKARIRKPDADAGTAGGVRSGAAGSIRAHRRRMGKNGNDPHSAGCDERECAGRCSARGHGNYGSRRTHGRAGRSALRRCAGGAAKISGAKR